MNNSLYCRSSGKVPWTAPLKVLTHSVPRIAVMAVVYAAVVRYNPLVYFSVVATLIFGVYAGLVSQEAAQKGNSRLRSFDGAAGVFIGLLAAWSQWLAWTALSLPDGLATAGHLASQGPQGWLEFFRELASHQIVSITKGGSRAAVSPAQLETLWALETILIVFVAGASASMAHGRQAFSERTQKWSTTEAKGFLLFDTGHAADIKAIMESEGPSWLSCLPLESEVPAPPGAQWKTLEIECICEPSDPEFRFINIAEATRIRRAKDRIKTAKSSPLVSLLRVEPSVYAELVRRFQPTVTPKLV